MKVELHVLLVRLDEIGVLKQVGKIVKTYGLAPSDIVSGKRTRPLPAMRAEVVKLVWSKFPMWSPKYVADFFGIDRATVLAMAGRLDKAKIAARNKRHYDKRKKAANGKDGRALQLGDSHVGDARRAVPKSKPALQVHDRPRRVKAKPEVREVSQRKTGRPVGAVGSRRRKRVV